VLRQRRRTRLALERLEMERKVSDERMRIARDIHDDLGSSLNEIGLLSELAHARLDQPEQAGLHIDEIFEVASRATRSVDEIVWAISPANDTLEGTVAYACKCAEDHLRRAGIRCRLDIPVGLPRRALDSAIRHHLCLAVREAVNNVVKHAASCEVRLRISLDAGSLAVVIADDGCGFDVRAAAAGSPGPGPEREREGLGSMAWRLKTIGGRCEIESRPGHGTVVRLRVRLNPAEERR
jgi:signal transduction histidine kinase